MNFCECCGKSKATSWWLVDGNAEVELCSACAADLKKECEMEKLAA